MSIQTLSEQSDLTNNDCLQTIAMTQESLTPEQDNDFGDRFSMSSVSPFPKQEPPLGKLTSDSTSGEVTKPCMSSLSQDSLSSMVRHASPPLESITELDEAEEQSSGCRSPGDGQVRFKSLDANNDLVDLDLEKRKASKPGSRDENLHGPVLVQSAESALKSLNVYEDTLTDATRSSRDLSGDSCPLECVQKNEKSSPGLSSSISDVCGFQPGLVNHNTTEPDDHIKTLEAQDQNNLQSFSISLSKEPDIGEKLGCQGNLISAENMVKDLRNGEEGHLLTRADKKIDENQVDMVTIAEADSSNDSLIEVLTACKSKVEQLELLELSSHELTGQLQSAQAMAAGLHGKVQWLEQEHSIKQREMEDLLEELERVRGALEKKSAEINTAYAQIQMLQLRLGEQQHDGAAGVSEALANGQTNKDASLLPKQNSNNSRVCRLL